MHCYYMLNSIIFGMISIISLLVTIYILSYHYYTELWYCNIWNIYLVDFLFTLLYLFISLKLFFNRDTYFFTYSNKPSFYGIILLFFTVVLISCNFLGYFHLFFNNISLCSKLLNLSYFTVSFLISIMSPFIFILMSILHILFGNTSPESEYFRV